ncbi:MAG: hypothetical protein KME52_27785 [Desmonostoc geniculatum HA4340-LM1]|jgi:hypothetical protein|nr:hypothetical protein [Desmonostoc geniculatum HA4340-LM1]
MVDDEFLILVVIVTAISLVIKIALYCFAIWELAHFSWMNAIASVLIAEFLWLVALSLGKDY